MKNESRRQFLKGSLGMLGGAMVSQAARLFPELQAALAQGENPSGTPVQPLVQSETGELYEGFLLLPDPDELPNVSIEETRRDEVEIVPLGSVSEALTFVSFPLYALRTLPPGISFAGTYLEKYKSSQQPQACAINYLSKQRSDLVAISITALAEYPKPYPIRPVHKLKNSYEEIEFIYPEKVSFLPTPGLVIPSAEGHLLLWIQDDVLYSLISEHVASREAAVNLAKALELFMPV